MRLKWIAAGSVLILSGQAAHTSETSSAIVGGESPSGERSISEFPRATSNRLGGGPGLNPANTQELEDQLFKSQTDLEKAEALWVEYDSAKLGIRDHLQTLNRYMEQIDITDSSRINDMEDVAEKKEDAALAGIRAIQKQKEPKQLVYQTTIQWQNQSLSLLDLEKVFRSTPAKLQDSEESLRADLTRVSNSAQNLLDATNQVHDESDMSMNREIEKLNDLIRSWDAFIASTWLDCLRNKPPKEFLDLVRQQLRPDNSNGRRSEVSKCYNRPTQIDGSVAEESIQAVELNTKAVESSLAVLSSYYKADIKLLEGLASVTMTFQKWKDSATKNVTELSHLIDEHESLLRNRVDNVRVRNIRDVVRVVDSEGASIRNFSEYTILTCLGAFVVLHVLIMFGWTNRQLIESMINSNYLVNIFSVFIIMICICMLAVNGRLDEKDVATLIAAISGYVLGQLGRLSNARRSLELGRAESIGRETRLEPVEEVKGSA